MSCFSDPLRPLNLIMTPAASDGEQLGGGGGLPPGGGPPQLPWWD